MVRRPAAGRGAPRQARFTRLNTASGTTNTAASASAASTFTTTTGPAAVDTTRRGRRWPVIGVAETCVSRSGCLDGGQATDERANELPCGWTGRPTMERRAGRTGTTNRRTNTIFRFSVGVVRGVFPYRR